MAHLSYKSRCILFLALISCIVIGAVKFILPYFYPFLFAYWLAKGSSPIVFCLHKRLHIPKTLANIITQLLILFIIGVLLFLLLDSLFQQTNRLIDHLPIYKESLLAELTDVCLFCDSFLKLKTGTTIALLYEYTSTLTEKGVSVVPTFTRQTITLMFQTFRYFALIGITLISALLIVQENESLTEAYHSCLLFDDIDHILKKLSQTGLKYLKMQLVIIAVIAIICTIGLFLSHSSYPLLLGILIALFDALPFLGSGTILVPWAIIKLFSHKIIGAAILMSTYLICQITRQFLESKLLGNTLGLAPIYFIMSLFIGIEIYGFTGIILGPFSILLIRTIYQLYKPKSSENQL